MAGLRWVVASLLAVLIISALAVLLFREADIKTTPIKQDFEQTPDGDRAVREAEVSQVKKKLADGCRYIYLDIGSNIGVQVRKLFEPELYPAAYVHGFFNERFGPAEERKLPTEQSGICAFGFEPNRNHTARLQRLQECYRRKGWRVHFFTETAVTNVAADVLPFFSDGASEYEEWGTSILDPTHQSLQFNVTGVDLAQFIQDEILPRDIPEGGRPPVVFAKFDIEGSEFWVLPHLLLNSHLCAGHIDFATVEWHGVLFQQGGVRDWEFFQANIHRMMALDPENCTPTQIVDLDDETYLHDESPFPAECQDGPPL
mmetsp:Transcript_30549/g.76659  ORF Transcript_30549/g.76659 Transcript_30549/m.76659 type:complete len:315 (-) Transcript_30549:177-1121(-)